MLFWQITLLLSSCIFVTLDARQLKNRALTDTVHQNIDDADETMTDAKKLAECSSTCSGSIARCVRSEKTREYLCRVDTLLFMLTVSLGVITGILVPLVVILLYICGVFGMIANTFKRGQRGEYSKGVTYDNDSEYDVPTSEMYRKTEKPAQRVYNF